MKLFFLLLVSFFLVQGCAAPRPEPSSQFISSHEFLTVRLAREAATYYGQSRYIDAELRYRQALYLTPQARNLRQNLALTLVKLTHFDEAQGIYKKLLIDEPKPLELQVSLANLFYEKGDFENAAKHYKIANELAIEDLNFSRASEIAQSLAVLSFKRGNEEQALCYSSEALNLAPSTAQTFRHARMLMALGYFDTALGMVESFPPSATERSTPEFAYISAVSNFALGNRKQAFYRANEFLQFDTGTATFQPELRIVQALSRTEPAEESIQEKEEENLASLRASEFYSQSLALYLPENLLAGLVEAPGNENPS